MRTPIGIIRIEKERRGGKVWRKRPEGGGKKKGIGGGDKGEGNLGKGDIFNEEPEGGSSYNLGSGCVGEVKEDRNSREERGLEK